MSELTLEVGKTYVYKDEQARQDFLNSETSNCQVEIKWYKCGFTISGVTVFGTGLVGGYNVITLEELKYFKLKEEFSEEALKDSPTCSDDLFQQLLTRVEALEQQLKGTTPTEKEIPLGQLIKSFLLHTNNSTLVADKATLGEITEAINYLSATCNSTYDIFYLALFPEADGSYSGSIFQSMVGSGQDDILWFGFDKIII